MVDVLTPDDLAEIVPGISDRWAQTLLKAANAGARRLAPCLRADVVDEGLLAEARVILLHSIERITSSRSWVRSETRGPFSISYVTGGRGLFDDDDRAALAALCSATPSSSGMPRGSFPEPDNYDNLFARPGRAGWR